MDHSINGTFKYKCTGNGKFQEKSKKTLSIVLSIQSQLMLTKEMSSLAAALKKTETLLNVC